MQTGYLPEKNLPLLQNNTKDIPPESTDMKKNIEAEWLLCSSAALWNSLCLCVHVCVGVCYRSVAGSVCLITAKAWSNSAHERVNTSLGLGITCIQTKTNTTHTHTHTYTHAHTCTQFVFPTHTGLLCWLQTVVTVVCSCLCILTWPFQTGQATSSSALWS